MGNKAQKAKAPAGFDSLGAAVRAWCFEGVEPIAQAERAGVSLAGVYYHMQKMKREGGAAADVVAGLLLGPDGRHKGGRRKADTRGIWTPEKLSKAHRLFGKTMLAIAEALEVPPKELLEYGLKSVLPPMGEGQRIAQLLEDHSQEPPTPPTAPTAAEFPDPQLENDIADVRTELLQPPAPEAEPVPETQAAQVAGEPQSEPTRRYRLINGFGEYLDRSGIGMTRKIEQAWVGSAPQMEEAFKRKPTLKELDPVRVA